MVPMGALLKALLVNSAQRMKGLEANAHNQKYGVSYPNFDQGFGTVALQYAVHFEVRGEERGGEQCGGGEAARKEASTEIYVCMRRKEGRQAGI